MAYPPATLVTDRTGTTPTVGRHADDHNLANQAINDIVAILGTTPQGAQATLSARLDILDDAATYAGSGIFTGPQTFEGGAYFKGRPVFSVRAYGAIGDGAAHPLSERYATLIDAQVTYPHATALTDQIDWAAIQAAVNAAAALGSGVVQVDRGTFLVNRTVTPASNVEVIGTGWSSIVKLTNGANPALGIFGNIYSGAAVSFFAVRNLQIDGNKLNNNVGSAIAVNGGFGNEVTGCYIHDTPFAAAVLGSTTANQSTGSGRHRLSNNLVLNPGLVGNFWGALAFTGGDVLLADGNIVVTTEVGVMAYSIDVEPNPGWTAKRAFITGNHCLGAQIVASASGGSVVEGAFVSGNYVDTTGSAANGPAIRLSGVTGYAVVTANPYLKGPGNTSAVIELDTLTLPVVTDNVVTGMGVSQDVYPNNAAVWLKDCAGGWINGNLFAAAAATHASTSAGIRKTGTTANVHQGLNRFVNVTVTGQEFSVFGVTPSARAGSTSDIKDALVAYGLLQNGGATPLDLDNGVLWAGSINIQNNTFVTAARDVWLANIKDAAGTRNWIAPFSDEIRFFGTGATGMRLGMAATDRLAFYGGTTRQQAAAIANAAGGAIIDAEARAALNALLAVIRASTGVGLIAG